MEALQSTITSLDFSKDIKFKKETLVEELLSLGHAKITPQIATLIGNEVEAEIQKRKNFSLTSEFVSELVAEKLAELGLIKTQNGADPRRPANAANPMPPARDSLSEDILEVLSPRQSGVPVSIPPEIFSKEPLRYSPQARKIMEKEFCVKNEKGEAVETPEELLARIARAVAEADAKFEPMADLEQIETNFYNMMATRAFLPDASILAHAGKSPARLFSASALLVRDTTESIFETMKQAALLHKSGAGAVISFSQLRPSLDEIASTHTKSSGPVTFMKIFDAAMQAFAHEGSSSPQDGVFLNIDHPDIFNFISQAITNTPRLKSFVGIGESFMKAVRQDADFALINPRRGLPMHTVRARKLFRHLVSHICKTGEPGLLFLDRLEKANPTPKMGFLVATSADGAQAFLPYETSASGFINLSLCAQNGTIDREKLKNLVRQGVHFLENTLEIGAYPFPENAEIVKKNRKIGLGLMGWATLLEKMKISYGTEEACDLASEIMALIASEADNASVALARQRGSFPNYHDSPLSLRTQKRRHAVVTALANSERASCLAECQAGISPATPLKEGLDAEWRLRMQAAFQNHTENGVYLPLDLEKDVTEEEAAKMVILAHQLGLKSVVFRRPSETSALRLVCGSTADTAGTAKISVPAEKKAKPDDKGTYFTP